MFFVQDLPKFFEGSGNEARDEMFLELVMKSHFASYTLGENIVFASLVMGFLVKEGGGKGEILPNFAEYLKDNYLVKEVSGRLMVIKKK